MTTQTHFFDTRTLARNFLNESTAESAKFKDFGSTAPKGERWAVLVEVPDVQSTDHTAVNLARSILLDDAAVIAKQPSGIIGEQHLKTSNGKTCVVSWRRRMTPIRLAKHLAKLA
jgi:hypothetical protein